MIESTPVATARPSCEPSSGLLEMAKRLSSKGMRTRSWRLSGSRGYSLTTQPGVGSDR